MKSKVEIKRPNESDKASRIVGTIFIGLGILLVAFGVYSFLKYKSEPIYNEEIAIPTIEYITDLVNGVEITVKGNTEELDSVALFINDERVDEVNVKDNVYELTYEVEGEGEYAVSVAGLAGFPFREIGPRSESKMAVVDMTAPDTEALELEYAEETNKETFTLKGSTEPKVTVELTRGIDTYQVEADKTGDFEIENIALDEGKNVFYLSLTDPAGNTGDFDDKVRIAYSPDADLNGDGASVAGVGDELPQAGGELDNLLAQRLMLIFGIAAIFVFAGSSIYAFKYRK